ncbi:hypothetical protein HYZ97_04840, partial [Candidatus Pacearchaeota archaeon]|nr:hypothetical protein [Candidatus Pacearchaeota archaeon]
PATGNYVSTYTYNAQANNFGPPANTIARTDPITGQVTFIGPLDVAILQINAENARHVATEARLLQGQQDNLALAYKQLEAQNVQVAQQYALESQKLNAMVAEGALDRASAEAINASNRASAERIAGMNNETQMKIANMQEKLERLGMSLNAAQASGYIPASLAKELGIPAGPTLESQKVAWGRFMDAMTTFVQNPRNIVGYMSLVHGMSPEGDINKPIPFLAGLSGQLQNVPSPNIGANQAAISQNAREFAAVQAEGIPPLFTNEQLNPQALGPMGGTGLLSQLNRPQQQASPFGGRFTDFINRLRTQYATGSV